MANDILVPVDFSDVTEAVVAEARSLARAMNVGIRLLHVAVSHPAFVGYEIGPMYVRDAVAGHLRMQHQKLQEYERALKQEGFEVTAMLVHGSPAEKILAEARRLEPSMIIMGSHGHGALHNLLGGSVCRAVLKRARRPVLIVPSRMAAKRKQLV